VDNAAVTKVAVIGNAGGGKTVLSRALAAGHHLPLLEVDQIQWKQPGWQPVAEETVREQLSAVLEEPTWIIDGWGPWDTIDRRIAAADTVVVVDMPLWRHYVWASKRGISDRRYPLIRLYRTMWTVHRDSMPQVRERLEHEPAAKVWHLRSPRDIREFANAMSRR
jgi:adenylate kinase family enzyme